MSEDPHLMTLESKWRLTMRAEIRRCRLGRTISMTISSLISTSVSIRMVLHHVQRYVPMLISYLAATLNTAVCGHAHSGPQWS